MAKTALVLSGGGAKGAFQYAAEKVLREELGYHWDTIAGVSVGNLNAVMLAMKRYQRLEQIWKTTTNEDIYTGKVGWWSAVKMFLFKKRSFLSNKPLRRLIEKEVRPEAMLVPVKVGAVSLTSGQYRAFLPEDPWFKDAVLASTIMPLIWEPLRDYKGDLWVDGGLRNISPLGDVLDSDPDKIVIINCSPRAVTPASHPIKTALDVGRRSLEIALNEIFQTDMREFLRINALVRQAQEKGTTLTKPNGKPYKFYKTVIVEPDRPLGDTIDFSREHLNEMIDAGEVAARRARVE